MSRGYGVWQRAILDALAKSDRLVPLGGRDRSESGAILRAAKTLERAGLCVIVRLWNDAHTATVPLVCRPGHTIDGKPAAELSVARVPHGTGTALRGSLRHLARRFGVSKTQVARDLKAAGKG
jgi:hypothetical protein